MHDLWNQKDRSGIKDPNIWSKEITCQNKGKQESIYESLSNQIKNNYTEFAVESS